MTKEEQIQVLEIAIKTAIEVLENEKKEQPTIPTFAESAEAFKAWAGEEMGGTSDPIPSDRSDLVRRGDVRKAICEVCLDGGTLYNGCKHPWNCPYLTKIGKLPTVSVDLAFIPVPKNCAECWEKSLHVAVDCNAKGDCGWDGDKRAEDCPIARPHGEWECFEKFSTMEGECGRVWICTNCCCEGNPDMNYCPNCGADMRGERGEQTDNEQ